MMKMKYSGLLVIFFMVIVASCEKETPFSPESSVVIRIRTSVDVGVQFGDFSERLTVDPGVLDIVLLKGAKLEFFGENEGEVIVNLDTLVVQNGDHLVYVVTEETKVPEQKECEVWPERCLDQGG